MSAHYQAAGRHLDLRAAFALDPLRATHLTLQAPHVLADLSKQRLDLPTVKLLLDLASECRLPQQRDALLGGEPVNSTEGRAALHTALRAPPNRTAVSHDVQAMLSAMLAYAQALRNAVDAGSSPIRHIVHIGIGGSDLGPQMVVQALQAWAHSRLHFHFVSNVDGADLMATLQGLAPQETLFIIASKTFTTQETMANAQAARAWFLAGGMQPADIATHFVGTTSNAAAARALGITTTFGFWDWVGGRFSLWSAIGLPIALAIGAEAFRSLLAGAQQMDQHFATEPLGRNLPVLLGLSDIWNRNFHGWTTRCVAPYHQGLRRLPAYLQQLEMESNGKRVDLEGEPLSYATSPVVWGEPGTNSQHAYFQMLHQGSDVVPVEFILFKQPTILGQPSADLTQRLHQQHQLLLANGLAQAQALMQGKTTEAALAEGAPTASPNADALTIAKHRSFPGNRPSTTLVLERLAPDSLGALIALYEHRVFVSGALWGINSFDQWGVELGKSLAQNILPRLLSGETSGLDASTARLLQHLRS